MNIAIFDIDGTLTQTQNLYDECYVQAVEETLGVNMSRSWNRYAHSTDSGIMHEACIQGTGRSPSVQDIAAVQKLYLSKLSDVSVTGEPVPGAEGLIEAFASHCRWVIAIATGNWNVAGRFKLSRANIAADSIPFATADDAFDRKDIIRIAISRTADRLGRSGFDRAVYIGDAAWDMAAAYDLSMSFVRRGAQCGNVDSGYLVSHSLVDFSDQAAALDAIENASVPLRE